MGLAALAYTDIYRDVGLYIVQFWTRTSLRPLAVFYLKHLSNRGFMYEKGIDMDHKDKRISLRLLPTFNNIVQSFARVNSPSQWARG